MKKFIAACLLSLSITSAHAQPQTMQKPVQCATPIEVINQYVVPNNLKAMFIAGVMMASTNLLFSVLAWSDKSEFLFAIAVIFDDIAAAFATVAFVAFISMLVDRAYTATQYALLASIGTAGRTTLASSSGALVDWLNGDWGIFFILTALMVIPSLIILWIMKNKLPVSYTHLTLPTKRIV